MNSDASSIKPLQFDTAIPSVAAETDSSQHGAGCVNCKRPLVEKYYDVDGQSVCETCRNQVAQLAETPREWGVFVRACLYGFVAAILGAIVYYAVIAITNFEIGIVAIAIGFMVGFAIRMATEGRGGRRFQVAALLLTYWAVGLAYTPLLFSEMSKPDATQEAITNTSASASGAADEDEPEAEPAEAVQAEAVNLPFALAAVLALSFALPILSVASSLPGGLISAAIIAFGMQQAWRMTAAPQPKISGPFRIGARPPATA